MEKCNEVMGRQQFSKDIAEYVRAMIYIRIFQKEIFVSDFSVYNWRSGKYEQL